MDSPVRSARTSTLRSPCANCSKSSSLLDRADDRRDADIGDHLERQRRSEHSPCVLAGEVISEERESDRGQPRADEGQRLCGEQALVDSICERGEKSCLHSLFSLSI